MLKYKPLRLSELNKIYTDYNWTERDLDLKLSDIGKILLYRYTKQRDRMISSPTRIFKVISMQQGGKSFMINLLKTRDFKLVLEDDYSLWNNKDTVGNTYKLYELTSDLDLLLLKLELDI
jgi:hypothetical protein